MNGISLQTLSLINQARVVVGYNLAVRSDELVLIVADGTIDESLVLAFQIAVREAGAAQSTLFYEPLSRRSRREYCYFAGASLNPEATKIPKHLEASIRVSDAVLLLCSDMDLLMSPTWLGLLDQSGSEKGPRIIFLPYLNTSQALRMLPEDKHEVWTQQQLVNKCGRFFDSASEAHITSDSGTNLRLGLGQWPTRLHTGVPRKGGIQVLPAGQITRLPNDGSASGILVIDRTIAHNDYKALNEPIAFHIESGKIIDIEGGNEAKQTSEFLKSLDDPRIYHLTELGIGTNQRCRFDADGGPTEDTHKWGTVSLALGCDIHIGGGTAAPAHIDMTMRAPSLKLNSNEIIREGKLLMEIRD